MLRNKFHLDGQEFKNTRKTHMWQDFFFNKMQNKSRLPCERLIIH